MMLYCQTEGQGSDIVLLHGWGMNAEVWHDVVPSLKQNYRVTVLDLPGHGRSSQVQCDYSLDELVEVLNNSIPTPCSLVGWSLGGLLAQAYALSYPANVGKLVLVASNAQFQRGNNWESAMKAEILDGFVANLQQDYKATLNQFLMLQVLGADNAKQTVRELKQRLFQYGEPDQKALQGGLQLLKNISLVDKLSQILCPTLLINGRLDGLVPVAAGEYMQAKIPHAELKIIDKAAHAPFISHRELFLKYLNEFLNS